MSTNEAREGETFKKYVGLTALIGFGFFTIGLMDGLYDSYVPIFLGKYISEKVLINLVMTLDNVLQLFLIPIVAAWSDRTRTPMGRRMPFILALLPAAAVSFGILPYAWGASLAWLVAAIFVLNLFKTSVRGPVVALMPDTIPGKFRSEANGVINTMGGLGTIIGTLILAKLLMDIDVVLPFVGPAEGKLPFLVAGLLVVVAVVVLLLFVRERNRDVDASEERIPVLKSLKAVFEAEDKSAMYILLSIFLWFMSQEGIKPLLSQYAVDILGVSMGDAALPVGVAAVAYAVFAIPSGYVAHKYGRKKVIRVSLVAMLALFVVMFALCAFGLGAGIAPRALFYAFMAAMGLYGVFWGTVITNSFPMLWQMANFGNIGMFTGLYYVASQGASIVAPPITGAILDLLAPLLGKNSSGAYSSAFVFAALCIALALFTMSRVTKGEARDHAIPTESS